MHPALALAPVPHLDLDAGLSLLGHERFRPGQREAIETLIEGGKLLLVAPTGGGKSLVYQLPGALLGGTTLVISPLIALMHDQVAALEGQGVAATYLASTLDRDELGDRLKRLARGEYKLVYVAPERLGDPWFQSVVAKLVCPLVAIDEAHCISEWGHDFRPEYLQIGRLLAKMPDVRVLACTATATPIVRDEILARLGLPANTPQLVRGFARPNLVLRAREVRGSKDRIPEVDRQLTEAIGAPDDRRGCAIVYSPTRKLAEEEAERLGRAGYRCRAYHAGRDAESREAVQDAFSSGELDVVVATNAFGMGIDRGDVRAVIHLGPPSSIESYYQEIGRAGRDGERAFGLMLWSSRDLPLRRRLIESPGDGVEPDANVVEHKWTLFLELMRWAEGGVCRHDAILRYFDDESESLGGCGQCDVCERVDESLELDAEAHATIVRKALSGVARVHRNFGLNAAVKLLHGDADPRLERRALDRTTTFGVLSDHEPEWITRLLQRCVTAGWVTFSDDLRPVLVLTRAGAAVMRAEAPPRIALPPIGGLSTRRGSSKPKKAPPPELDGAAGELFEALRERRLELSREHGVPPYVVATDRCLRDIAELRPRDRDQLLMAHGMGPSKAERFGDELLAVVLEAPVS